MGDLNYPLVSDLKREISVKYGVLSEEGVALRGLFIIDKEARPTRACCCVVSVSPHAEAGPTSLAMGCA